MNIIELKLGLLFVYKRNFSIGHQRPFLHQLNFYQEKGSLIAMIETQSRIKNEIESLGNVDKKDFKCMSLLHFAFVFTLSVFV